MRMRKALTGAALSLFCALLFAGRAGAQTRAPKFEAGAQFSSVSIDDPTDDSLSACNGCDAFVYKGIGGRFTYNLNDSVAFDSEVNFFLDEERRRVSRVVGGHPLEGLFGVKAGKRFRRVGVFAKARPGFVSFSRTIRFPLGVGVGPLSRTTHFAADLGGVVEFYPSRKFLVRADAGDTIIHYGEETLAGTTSPIVRATTTHNFQFSAGVGWRF